MINYFFLLTIFAIVKFGESTYSVFIHQEVLKKDSIMITCSISGDKALSYKAYLRCPLIDTNFCYKDCIAQCHYENGNCVVPPELKSIESCFRKTVEVDHLQIQYTINTRNVKNLNGEWFCSFEGKNSKSIKLNVTPNENTIHKSTQSSKIQQIPKFAKSISSTEPIPIVVLLPKDPLNKRKTSDAENSVLQEKNMSKKEKESEEEFNFRSFITRYQVVIGIVCLLSLSVLLNFIFYIRDSMIKQFIDNIKSNNQSNKYLLFCICQNEPDSISATAKLDKILSKESDRMSTGGINNSKNDIFITEPQRPLLSSFYLNNDNNFHQNIIRSTSMLNQQNPRMIPMTYDPYRMATSRGYAPYIYDPYSMTRDHLGISNTLQKNANQRYSYIFPSEMKSQNIFPAAQLQNKKMHASENDIDLIRHCDSQEHLS